MERDSLVHKLVNEHREGVNVGLLCRSELIGSGGELWSEEAKLAAGLDHGDGTGGLEAESTESKVAEDGVSSAVDQDIRLSGGCKTYDMRTDVEAYRMQVAVNDRRTS